MAQSQFLVKKKKHSTTDSTNWSKDYNVCKPYCLWEIKHWTKLYNDIYASVTAKALSKVVSYMQEDPKTSSLFLQVFQVFKNGFLLRGYWKCFALSSTHHHSSTWES